MKNDPSKSCGCSDKTANEIQKQLTTEPQERLDELESAESGSEPDSL